MYNEQLEKLIEMALMDGELSDKEKQVLFKKAESFGIDLDEFEMVLDAKLHAVQKAASPPPTPVEPEKPKSNKEGDVKKCPSCGAPVQSFATKCSDCGHEFRNTQTSSSKQKLYDEFQKVETEERSRKLSFTEKLGGEVEIAKRINNRLSNTISTFPIPNSKEDLLEFFSLAIAESKKGGGIQDNGILRKAWKSKANELKSKIVLDLKNDSHALLLMQEYKSSKKGIILTGQTKIIIGVITMFIILFYFIGIMIKAERKDKENESSRIELVETNIERLISEKRYEEALIQVEKISWNVEPNIHKELAETTNNKREELKKTINDLIIKNK